MNMSKDEELDKIMLFYGNWKIKNKVVMYNGLNI